MLIRGGSGSIFARAHQHAAGVPQKTVARPGPGRSRGGLSMKIHALVDRLGMLAKFHLTGRQAGDSPEALPLLGVRSASIADDKDHDTDALIEQDRRSGCHPESGKRAYTTSSLSVRQSRRALLRPHQAALWKASTTTRGEMRLHTIIGSGTCLWSTLRDSHLKQ